MHTGGQKESSRSLALRSFCLADRTDRRECADLFFFFRGLGGCMESNKKQAHPGPAGSREKKFVT
jgi:hypothetical protein